MHGMANFKSFGDIIHGLEVGHKI